MKYTVVGLCNKIAANLPRIKIWASSFKKHCRYGEIVLLCANSSSQEISECARLGVCAIPVRVAAEHTIYHQRLLSIQEYVGGSEGGGFFLVTDVFDVVFQSDPFAMCDLSEYELFASEEGILVNQEPWNAVNIRALFPQDIDVCLNHPIVCSGVIGGKKDALLRLYEEMYRMCEYGSTNAHNIRDQAALIVLLAKKRVPKIRIFHLAEGWAVHCAVSGPTEFFEGWGFKSKLLHNNTPIPYMEDGVVKTLGNPFGIVHQYNRVSEWASVIMNQYP